MVEPMTALEARDYAPLWGSDASADDMAMYNLNDDGRPDDAEQRDLMIQNIVESCLPIARKRIADGTTDADEMEDVEKLEALKAYLEGLRFPTEPDESYQFGEPAEINGVDVETFARHYVIAMLWSSTEGEEGTPLDSIYGPENLALETWAKVERDCRAFLAKVGHLVTDANYIGRANEGAAQQAGHDFWLTRAGHGAGFWDGDWESDAHNGLQGPLTLAAKAAGELDPYAGDDGLIYC